MKNLKIQKIQKIEKIQNIQNINQNLNIPVGQIVLINVNKNRESLVQQEPLEQVESDLKKDADYLTKTKNTFTDRKLNGDKLNDVKYQAADRQVNRQPNDRSIQSIKPCTDKLLNIQNAKNRQVRPNVYHTPRVLDTKTEQKSITQQSTNHHHQQNTTNQQHNQVNNDQKQTQSDRVGQLKQSTASLNHHYERPDLLLSAKKSIIRSTDTSTKNITTTTIDGQSINAKQLTNLAIRTTNTPHYEKPITINKRHVSQNGVSKAGQLLDDSEVNQIEFFYKSQRTYVFVSRSMANLYFTQTDLVNNGRYSSPRAHEWALSRTGVPLIIFNKGGIKCRFKRQLRFALAERGSGFQLFSDVIDNLTDYKKMHDSFHTFYLSIDHRKMAGLSFDCSTSADEFLKQIEAITSNPKNISLTGPKFYSKKSLMNSKNQLNRCKSTIKKYKKSDISMPCLFQHITNLDMNDFEKFYSLSTLVARALDPNYPKTADETTGESDNLSSNLSSNLSKLSIENLSSSSTNCDSSTKQIHLSKPYNPSSICSYSSCSYTSSNEDHS